MRFIWQEGYNQMKSVVSRCWLEPSGHGLPPAFTSVLAGCQVGLHRVVYSASVDELGAWHFPEFQGDEADVTVLFWMPKPDVSMRFDTAFALNSDMMEAVLHGINREAQLAEAIKRAEAAERERDSLREQLQATDARAEGWRTARDNLRVAREEQRKRIAELEAEIERRNTAENRMFDGLEQLLNSDEPEE